MKVAAVVLAWISATSAFADPVLHSNPPVKLASMCFKTGEQESGMSKICYYDCLGSTYAITISNIALCPLSIDR